MRQSTNLCWVEGILNEVDFYEANYQRDGRTVEAIRGSITVLVERELDGIPTENIIPLQFFVNKYNKDGKTVNPSYKNLMKLSTDFVSIGASGSKENADRVRIPKAEIKESNFLGRDDQVVHTHKLEFRFIDKVRDKFEPKADFWVDMYLVQVADVLDNEGLPVEPARAKTKGILIGYGDRVDVVEFVANSPSVVSTVKGLEPNHLYKLKGTLDFTTTEVEAAPKMVEGGFGDTSEARKRTVSRKDFVIIGGNTIPFDDDFTPTENEIAEALANRKNYIDADIEKQRRKKNAKNNAAPVGRGAAFNLGF